MGMNLFIFFVFIILKLVDSRKHFHAKMSLNVDLIYFIAFTKLNTLVLDMVFLNSLYELEYLIVDRARLF